MSYFSPPQIFFKGKFCANVATGNNAGTIHVYQDPKKEPDVIDADHRQHDRGRGLSVEHDRKAVGRRVFDMVQVQIAPNIQHLTDDQIRKWMYQGRGDRGPNFNYKKGGNNCGFEDVEIVGVDVGNGIETNDLTSQRVSFERGSMVDLNPLGGNIATQIFGDKLIVGDAGAGQMTGTLERSYSRWVWWNRLTKGCDNPTTNPADDGGGGDHKGSAVFQSMIPKSSISFSGARTGVLAQFEKALDLEDFLGLSIRYCLYQASIEFQGADMTSKMTVTGVIGLQPKEQASTEPPGRYLISPQHSPTGDNNNNGLLGTLFVDVNAAQNRVSLDLITAIPEDEDDGQKKDCGELSLILNDGHQQWTLAKLVHSNVSGGNMDADSNGSGPSLLSYGKDQYDATSGLVSAAMPENLQTDSKFQSALAGNGVLQLVNTEQKELLVEVPLVVQCDDRCVYMQENETDVTIRFRLLDRGTPKPNTVVALNQFLANDFGQGYPCDDVDPAIPDEQYVSMPSEVETDADGVGTFTISGKIAGACVICFNPHGECWPNNAQSNRFDRLYSFYTNIRILPKDDYSRLTVEELKADDSFETIIYPEVLRYYYLLYPVMDNHLKLCDKSAILNNIEDFAEAMALDAEYPHEFHEEWEKACYMPRTREMSEGKRQLLKRWCDANPNNKP